MALYPNTFSGQERLQPGARGEMFQTDIPGYRDQGDRLNRTNNKLNTNAHDVPNIKYEFDRRLPVLFRYGFAYGYNQIVVPKGRIVAADPFMDLIDFEMKSQNNTLTLANGGVPVKLRDGATTYDSTVLTNGTVSLVSSAGKDAPLHNTGKDWEPLTGIAAYNNLTMVPFRDSLGAVVTPAEMLTAEAITVDEATGKLKDASGVRNDVRPGNIPLGIIQRNEYTRNDDAYNGIMPGAVLTDAMVELPWFGFKDKAEQNPWGSAYGTLFPGCLVKSDENGRFIPSPLSYPELTKTMSVAEYELERQQVLGQVYATNTDLVPEGAARWATWAIEDRLNFNEFNPATYRANNRDGEDAVNNSPYNSNGTYPGYPYDKNIGNNDLHMLASTARGYDQRLNHEYQYENLGIPGLTDGKNVATRAIGPEISATVFKAGDAGYQDIFLRTVEVDIEPGTLNIKIGDNDFTPCTVGAVLQASNAAGTDVAFAKVKYVSEEQGLVVLEHLVKADVDAAFAYQDPTNKEGIKIQFKYNKRGLAGVPTFLDWDGAVGSVKVLLTK